MGCKRMIEAWSNAASARFSCFVQHQPALPHASASRGIVEAGSCAFSGVAGEGPMGPAYRSLECAHTVREDGLAT